MFDSRAATLADAPAICELSRRSEAFDGVPRVLDLDELIEELESDAVHPRLDRRRQREPVRRGQAVPQPRLRAAATGDHDADRAVTRSGSTR
jgi:hypothetical protein